MHYNFPFEYWTRNQTNNVIERLNREICRRTRVVGTSPDGNSVLMLVCARLRHLAGTQWENKKYMNIKHLGVLPSAYWKSRARFRPCVNFFCQNSIRICA